MKTKQQRNKIAENYQRCQCGWIGTFSQLAIWLRKDKVVSKICPHCGTPSGNHKVFSPHLRHSNLVH
ncbi:hypothetical protein [Aurantivibrio infirmus]